MALSLPRIDGWEAMRRLKAGPLSMLPVIASPRTPVVKTRPARAAGCDGYLTKPVERDHLIATIKQHLKARSQQDPSSSPSASTQGD